MSLTTPPIEPGAERIGLSAELARIMAGHFLSTPALPVPAGRYADCYGSGVLMPLMFGLAGTVVEISAVFWTVGAMVGGGCRVAWRMRSRQG